MRTGYAAACFFIVSDRNRDSKLDMQTKRNFNELGSKEKLSRTTQSSGEADFTDSKRWKGDIVNGKHVTCFPCWTSRSDVNGTVAHCCRSSERKQKEEINLKADPIYRLQSEEKNKGARPMVPGR